MEADPDGEATALVVQARPTLGHRDNAPPRLWWALLAAGAVVPAVLALWLFVATWQIDNDPGPAESGDAAALQAYAGAGSLLTTAILVAVTGAYVFLTAQVAKETGRSASATAASVRVGQEELSQMRHQLKLGQRQLDEATLVRIDQRAPRVVALPGETSWPPLVERPSYSEVRRLEGSIVLPNRNDGLAWFSTFVLLRNESSTTGIISLPDDGFVYFDQVGGAFGRSRTDDPVPVSGGHFALLPDQEALLRVISSATFRCLADLVGHSTDPPIVCAHEITILDYFTETVITNIRFELRGRPIEEVPDDPGRWRPRERLPSDPNPDRHHGRLDRSSTREAGLTAEYHRPSQRITFAPDGFGDHQHRNAAMGHPYGLPTIKALFAEAAHCAYPDCTEPLVFEDASGGIRLIAVQIARTSVHRGRAGPGTTPTTHGHS